VRHAVARMLPLTLGFRKTKVQSQGKTRASDKSCVESLTARRRRSEKSARLGFEDGHVFKLSHGQGNWLRVVESHQTLGATQRSTSPSATTWFSKATGPLAVEPEGVLRGSRLWRTGKPKSGLLACPLPSVGRGVAVSKTWSLHFFASHVSLTLR
jgi:hypothetical protein